MLDGGMLPPGRNRLPEFLPDTLLERPRLLSAHSNERFFPGDHVVLFRVDAWETGERKSSQEIAEVGFFALDALPADLNRGSRARLDEVFGAAEISPEW